MDALTFLFSDRYIDHRERWAEFDFFEWSETKYEWTQVAWNGFRDVAEWRTRDRS